MEHRVSLDASLGDALSSGQGEDGAQQPFGRNRASHHCCQGTIHRRPQIDEVGELANGEIADLIFEPQSVRPSARRQIEKVRGIERDRAGREPLREVQRLSQEEGVNLSGIKRILELVPLVKESTGLNVAVSAGILDDDLDPEVKAATRPAP